MAEYTLLLMGLNIIGIVAVIFLGYNILETRKEVLRLKIDLVKTVLANSDQMNDPKMRKKVSEVLGIDLDKEDKNG